MTDMVERLRRTFRDGLGLGETAEVDGLTYRGLPEWDSIGHMRLVAAIETEFDIMLDTDEVIDMSSFEKAAETVSRHLANDFPKSGDEPA